jgi:hypothetical protein
MLRFRGRPRWYALWFNAPTPPPPGPQPSLELEFFRDTFDMGLVSHTGGANKTYFDDTGTMQVAADGDWPLEHNATDLTPMGRSVWEERTNHIRNNTMVGAVVGTPGTLPTNWSADLVSGVEMAVSAVGTESGIEYVDLTFSGVPDTTGTCQIHFDAADAIAAAEGDAWVGAMYKAVQSANDLLGVASQIINLRVAALDAAEATIDNFDDGFVGGSGPLRTSRRIAARAGDTALPVNTAYVRCSLAFDTAPGDLGVGEELDFTIRIGLPTLEAAATPSPAIKTSSAAVTRTADDVGPVLDTWLNPEEGTVFVRQIMPFMQPGSDAATVSMQDAGGTNNSVWMGIGWADAAQYSVLATIGGTTVLDGSLAIATPSANNWATLVIAYKSGDSTFGVDTQEYLTPTTDTYVTTPEFTTVRIGRDADGNYLNGVVSHFVAFDTRLTDSDIQSAVSDINQ